MPQWAKSGCLNHSMMGLDINIQPVQPRECYGVPFSASFLHAFLLVVLSVCLMRPHLRTAAVMPDTGWSLQHPFPVMIRDKCKACDPVPNFW